MIIVVNNFPGLRNCMGKANKCAHLRGNQITGITMEAYAAISCFSLEWEGRKTN